MLPILIRSKGKWHCLIDFSIIPDGALPSIFTGSTYTIATGKAVNTPTFGTDLVSNGNMEAGNPPTDWGSNGSILSSQADERTGGSGTKSMQLANDGANYGIAYQTFAIAADTWYYISAWLRKVTAEVKLRLYAGTWPPIGSHVTTTDWTNVFAVRRGEPNSSIYTENQDNTNGHTARADDISVKPITAATLFSTRKVSNLVGKIKAPWTIIAATQAGVVGWLDSQSNPLYFIIAYHDGTNAVLEKCVNGTYTTLINQIATYGSTKKVEIRKVAATTYQLWYGDVQIAADQTISDAGIISNQYFGLFSTYSGNGCGGLEVLPFDGTGANPANSYNPNTASASNAVAPLNTPTSDTSGEAAHPDVYDAGLGHTWNGYRYWMAMTPFPNDLPTYEFPEILASNDNVTWVVPAGLTNPIDTQSGAEFADPDLIMDGTTLWCIYYGDLGGGVTNILAKYSSDGVNWSARQTLVTVIYPAGASPAIVKYGSEWLMFTTGGGTTNELIRRTASTLAGPWSAPVVCSVPTPNNRYIWHQDVINVDGVLYGFFNINGTHMYFGTSVDGGLHWRMSDNPILSPTGDDGDWDGGQIYRGSAVATGTGFDFWYSACTTHARVWRIGFTTISNIES
jgi:hypothetical protein